MHFFDAHAHLQLPQFDADRDEVLARMKKRGVGAVVVGTDYKTSQEALALAHSNDFLWAAVGLHPNDNKDEIFDEARYLELAHDPKVVAIGECGLDYLRGGTTQDEKDAQKKRFEQQIALALRVKKPLIIHCREAHEDMFTLLEDYMGTHTEVRAVIHFFTAAPEIAQRYLSLGCYLSFPGPVTYTQMYDESIRCAPLNKLLIETDAPFAAPAPFRGKRNEPVYVEEVLKKIALLKGETEQIVASQILANASSVFSIGV